MSYASSIKELEDTGFKVEIDIHSCIEKLEKQGYRVAFEHYRYETIMRDEVLSEIDYRVHQRYISILPRQMQGCSPIRYYRRGNNGFVPFPRGGLTRAIIKCHDVNTKQWQYIAVGESACVLEDAFCYKTGREYALLDAFRNLEDAL